MSAANEVVREVLALLSPMVEPDGGSMSIVDFSEPDSRLRIDYSKGVNEACATCVIDVESMHAFIDEGLRARGVHIDDLVVVDATPQATLTVGAAH